MPEEDREVAAASDGELWGRRAAYERETRWAPPYVVDELREAHLAEDTYRADAVRAWYRADAPVDETERAQARCEAEEVVRWHRTLAPIGRPWRRLRRPGEDGTLPPSWTGSGH